METLKIYKYDNIKSLGHGLLVVDYGQYDAMWAVEREGIKLDKKNQLPEYVKWGSGGFMQGIYKIGEDGNDLRRTKSIRRIDKLSAF